MFISILFIATIIIGMKVMLMIIGIVFSTIFLYSIYKKTKKSKLVYITVFAVFNILISTFIYENLLSKGIETE